MEFAADVAEILLLAGMVFWLVDSLLSPLSRPDRQSPEKMCEPWWKYHH